MFGCKKVIEEALKLIIIDMDIFCSYNGVKNIANGNRDIEKIGTISFDKYLKEIIKKIKFNFIAYNDIETDNAKV